MSRFSHGVRYSDLVKRAFVICVALVLPACKDHELEKMASVRDEVCACKTVDCATQAMGKLPTKAVPSTPTSQKIARAMLDCLADLYDTQTPSMDPDAEPAP